MASKEATIYIVDLGHSMGKKNNGRNITDLEWSLEYIWDKITAAVATERKTLNIGVLGLNTDDTEHLLASDEGYEHMSVLLPLQQVLMSDIRDLREKFTPSTSSSGDPISAIVVAMQMISVHCKHLKYLKKIVLLTNGQSPIEDEDIEPIAQRLKADSVDLVILGVDFDDAEYGFKEESKSARKADNEKLLKDLSDKADGAFGTLEEAISEMNEPRIKSVKPVPSYKGMLTLGDPHSYDTALSIDVERYPKVMLAKPPTASSFVVRSQMAPEESQHLPEKTDGPDDLAGIKRARAYHVPDEGAPGGKKEVDETELEKGYAYGSTAVYISESDRNVTTFETTPGLDIIGFVAKTQYAHYLDMSRTNVIVANRVNDKARLALSSLIHALHELDSYAVARFVPKVDKAPLILLLAPSIEIEDGKTFECLYDVELPFAEDIRQYRFPPLDRIITVSGKTITRHRNLPSDDLQDAISAYVDAMDLTANEEEYAPIDQTFSPVLHRIKQVVQFRAIYPDAPLPPVPRALTRFQHPDVALIEAAKPHIDAVQAAAEIKKVPPKALSRRGRVAGDKKDVPKPLSGLDIAALLGEGHSSGATAHRVDPANPIPTFKQSLDVCGSIDDIKLVTQQLGEIIRNLVTNSVGDAKYNQAIETAGALRAAMIEFEEPEFWNDFATTLREDALNGKLGGNRRDFWWRLRISGLGLIVAEGTGKGATAAEAEAFKKGKIDAA